MKAYYLTRPLILRTASQSRALPAANQAGAPFTTEIHIAAQNESRLVHEALQKTYPQEPVNQLVHTLSPESVARLPGIPPFLGLQAFANPAEATKNCLMDQLQALRSCQPERLHYRLLLMNGFGTNLGDNLIGLTAFRQVWAVLRKHLPNVLVDVLLGWHPDDRLTRLFRDMEGIGIIRTQGLTFAELKSYQALFDTGDLLSLPRYGRMPMVDWYLWWMGIAPDTIPLHDKRNAVTIPEEDRRFIAEQLPPANGPRILINPKASVSLRSMPESAICRLVEALMVTWPDALIILMQPSPFEDPRVINLAPLIPNVDRLAALVAAIDGLIGVDTFTAHLADAVATPAVTLFTSVLPDIYPYYPLNEALVLPNADQLPAWGKPKVTEEAWAGMADVYEALWQAWDPELIITSLRRAMEKKIATPNVYESRILPSRALIPASLTRVLEVDGHTLELPLRQVEGPLVRVLNTAIAKAATQFLCAGDTVSFLGAGAGETALGLARMVGQQGRLVAIEPRRVLHQLLCANLARANIWHAETHLAMPEKAGFSCQKIDGLQLGDQSSPLSLSNSEQSEPVLCWPFDALAINICRLIVVSSPLARLEVLEGARATLERLHPIVLVGVVAIKRDGAAFETFFNALNYRIRTLALGDSSTPEQSARYGILVAEPAVG